MALFNQDCLYFRAFISNRGTFLGHTALVQPHSILRCGTDIAFLYPQDMRGLFAVEGILMEGPILIVDADRSECLGLCETLEREDYDSIPVHTLDSLDVKIRETGCQAVILDLDILPVNDRFFSRLRAENPHLPIIGLSSRSFHPELEKAMSTHICACIGKPPDIEELIYCLKSFSEKTMKNKKEGN